MAQSGKLNPNWKGGKINFCGYWYIHKPEHPFCKKQGYVAEHRLVMEKHIGRYLTCDEIVHHKNGNKKDNRIENLEITAYGKHIKWHLKENPWTSGPQENKSGFKNSKARKDILAKDVNALKKDGFSLDQIANKLGCSCKTVWNRLNHEKMKEGEKWHYQQTKPYHKASLNHRSYSCTAYPK